MDTLLWVRTATFQRIVQDKWLQNNAVYWAKVNSFDFLHVRCQTTCDVFPVGLFTFLLVLSKSDLCHYWALKFLHNSFFCLQLCMHCYLINCTHMWIAASVSDSQTCNQACPAICCPRTKIIVSIIEIDRKFFFHIVSNRMFKSMKLFQKEYF